MKVEVEIHTCDLDGDHGTVEGLCLTCEKCGHEVEVFGTAAASAKRGAAMLREECPEGEENWYNVNWYSD
jgi:hypothetical protein